MSYDPVKLQTNKLLLCEGKEEKAVVAQMIEEGLVQKVDVLALGDAKDPAEDKNAPEGIGSLAANLEGVSAMTGFRNIKSIGLLLDNDSDPKAAFAGVKSVLEKANGDKNIPNLHNMISIPNAPYTKGTLGDHISISTFFSPGPERNGCLETLILEGLSKLYGTEMDCVDDLVTCSGISSSWPIQKVDKAKVRAALSFIYRKNPGVTLAMLWKNDRAILPVEHESLKSIRDFIDEI